jgi:amino acid permease
VTSDKLITREEILTGLPARRASTLLFLIESRTAHMVAQSRQAMEIFLTQEAAEERDLAFLEAFALGRDPPLRPMIQDLERYAPQWAPLVPENPRVQAAVAHLLGQKYDFTYQAVPGIRAALGLDEEAVQQAYRRLYGQSLETIFAPRTTLIDRLRWAWAALARWLESLPPFWTAFALTLTETVGAGILALPIALASIGPLAGVVLLVVLGLVNVLTVASMAESVARSGAIRYGRAFIGRAVANYLGNIGSFIITLGLAVLNFLCLLAYYTGFSTTLEDATHVPAEVWTAVLFLIGLYFLRRESLNATVASALLVGMTNIGLILLLSLFAFTHVRAENLLYVNVPFLGGRPFDPSILQLIFGVVLAAYFGHQSLGNCARVVLRRDPSARSLIWGSMAGMATAMVLYCIWVLAVNGTIAPQALAGQSGTALVPLAAQVGPSVHVLGSIFATLAMGMASILMSLGLFNLVRERLPTRHQSVVMLPRRRGQLLFHQHGKLSGEPRIRLIYLGLKGGQPQFCLDVQLGGNTHRVEVAATGRWEATELLGQLPDLSKEGIRLTLEVLDASQESVHLRVDSPMLLTYEGEWDATGLRMTDALVLPDSLRVLVNWMMRREEVSFAEVVAHIGQDETVARTMLDTLMEQGFVREMKPVLSEAEGVEGASRYRVRFAPRRGRQLPEDIWQALGEEVETPAGVGHIPRRIRVRAVAQRAWEVLGERGRFFLLVSPVAAVFLLVEWLLFTDAESFAGPLSFLGVIVVSLLGGIFPVLLLISSRRKGEFVPGVVYRFLGHPLLITSIYFVFLASVFLHGLVIWRDPVERAGALFVGVLILGVTMAMVRRGAFAPRVVVELREDPSASSGQALSEGGRAVFAITADGQPGMAEVRLGYPEGEQRYQAAAGEMPALSLLRYAIFQLPAEQVQELKVWAHRITPEGDSEGLPVLLEVHCGSETTRFDLKLSGGQVLLPLTSEACRLEITLPDFPHSRLQSA